MIISDKLVLDIYSRIIKYDVCDVAPHLLQRINDTEFAKTSISKSVVMFSNLWNASENTSIGVASKIFFDLKSEDFIDANIPKIHKIISENEAIKYEAYMYRYLTAAVISKNVCHNFIGYIGYAECLFQTINLPEFAKTQLENLFRTFNFEEKEFKDYDNFRNNVKCGVLLTYRPPNTQALSEITRNLYELPEHEYTPHINSMLFQIFYALYVLENLKIMHNDLHKKNILIETLSEPTLLTYKLDKYVFVINTKYIVYIYDWDRGYCEKLNKNPILNLSCSFYNSCNFFVKNKDLYSFLCKFSFLPKLPFYDKSVLFMFQNLKRKKLDREYNPPIYKHQEPFLYTLSENELSQIFSYWRVSSYDEYMETKKFYHFVPNRFFEKKGPESDSFRIFRTNRNRFRYWWEFSNNKTRK